MSVGQEERDVRTPLRLVDAVSVAVGASHFVQNHRLAIQIRFEVGVSRRLRVSRFYWDLTPPVAIDFVESLVYGEDEVAAKKQYFEGQEIRYILAKGPWDGESVDHALTKIETPEIAAVLDAAKPLSGPRRSKRQ